MASGAEMPAAPAVVLVGRAAVSVRGEVVRIGDVAQLGGLAATERARVSRLPILRLARGEVRAMSRAGLASLIRRAVPGMPVAWAEAGDVVVRSVVAAPVSPCRSGDRVSRCEPLHSVPVRPAVDVARGAALVLRSRVGPVTIEREVTAMQPGCTGRRVFVRDAGGAVFAARVGESGAAR